MDGDGGTSLLKEIKDSLLEQNKILAKIESLNVQAQDPASPASADSQTSMLLQRQLSPPSPQESEDATCGARDPKDIPTEEWIGQCRLMQNSTGKSASEGESSSHTPSNADLTSWNVFSTMRDQNIQMYEGRFYQSLQNFDEHPQTVSQAYETVARDLWVVNSDRFPIESYASAQKILSPSSSKFSGVEDEDLGWLRQGLGAFQDLPCDARLHLPIEMGNTDELVSYIKRAVSFVKRLKKKHCSYDVSIFDCDHITGLHKYSVDGHEMDKVQRKAPPVRTQGAPTAPWSRLIMCIGLVEAREQVSFQNFFTSHQKQTGLHFCSWIRNLQERGHPRAGIGHLNGSMATMTFHVTTFSIVPSFECVFKSTTCGPLYGGKQGFNLIHEVSGLFAVSGEGSAGQTDMDLNSYSYYTILLLVPQGRDTRLSRISRSSSSMHWHVLDIISHMLASAEDRWESIDRHMRSLLEDDSKLMILSPDMHDKLLFDDETFSRSRKYFWAIDALETFEMTIRGTIRDWEDFRQTCFEKYKFCHGIIGTVSTDVPPDWIDPSDYIGRIEQSTELLRWYCDHFQEMRSRTQKLREALFTASAVVETRSATQLGENVRLLTYVSIFYLPLAFCISLWGIDKMPSQGTFAGVIIAVASATYLAVFNLKNIVAIGYRIYNVYKRNVFQQMKNDMDPGWGKTAQGFEQFKPKIKRMMPTFWLLLVYSLLWVASLVGLRRTKPSTAKPSSDQNCPECEVMDHGEWTSEAEARPATDQKGFSFGWLGRIFRRRDNTNPSASTMSEIP